MNSTLYFSLDVDLLCFSGGKRTKEIKKINTLFHHRTSRRRRGETTAGSLAKGRYW